MPTYSEKSLVIIFFFGFWLYLFAKLALAEVVVNELYPNPNTGEDEWAELWNTGSSSVDLTNWKLWDQLTTPSVAYSFASGQSLATNSFLVVTLHSVLNNSGDDLVLKNPAGQDIDTLAYTSSTKGKSWAKNPNNLADIFESDPTPNQANLAPTPTPTVTPTPTLTSTPTPSPVPVNLMPTLSEIMACPADSDEWIEVANPHDSALNLAGFTLRDSKNQIFNFTDQELEPQEFLAVTVHNVLNNTGDSVSLISPANQVLDTFSYTKCDADQSWAKNGDTWQQTAFITQNAANIFAQSDQQTTVDSTANFVDSEPTPTPTPSINPTNSTTNFLYPPNLLKPKLAYDPLPFPDNENIAFGPPPRFERGAISVIMGSLFLLIPGAIYVKNRQTHF